MDNRITQGSDGNKKGEYRGGKGQKRMLECNGNLKANTFDQ